MGSVCLTVLVVAVLVSSTIVGLVGGQTSVASTDGTVTASTASSDRVSQPRTDDSQHSNTASHDTSVVAENHDTEPHESSLDRQRQAGEINLTVSVDGTETTDGQLLVNESSPNVSVAVTSVSPVESVEIVVDGSRRVRNDSVGNGTVRLTEPLQLDSGRHTITVVARTANGTATHEIDYVRGEIGISMRLDGNRTDDGERIVNDTDPSLSITVSATKPIQGVLLRVDNDDRFRTLSVNNTTFTLDRSLSLGPGRHPITVIASTNNETETHTVRFIKDRQGPVIQFSSPPNVSLFSVDEFETTNATYPISFSTRDFVDVERVEMTLKYYGQQSGETDGDGQNRSRLREQMKVTFDSSKRQFERTLLLGPGLNSIAVETEDGFGNVRTKRFDLILTNDGTPPNLTTPVNFTGDSDSVTLTTETDTFQLDGTLRDQTGLRRVTLTTDIPGGLNQKTTLLSPPPDNRTAGRQSASFSRSVSLEPGNNTVKLTASDLFGNTLTRTYRIVYDPVTLAERVHPEIRFYRNRSRLRGDEARLYVAVADGIVRSVTVEGRGLTTRQTGFFRVAYDGGNRSRVVFDQTVPVDEQRTEVVVGVTDALGRDHTANLTIDRETNEFLVGNETESGFVVIGEPPDPNATRTPTPTMAPTPTPVPTPTPTPSSPSDSPTTEDSSPTTETPSSPTADSPTADSPTAGSPTAGSPTAGSPTASSPSPSPTPGGSGTASPTPGGGSPAATPTAVTEALGQSDGTTASGTVTTPGNGTSGGFLAPSGGGVFGGSLTLAVLLVLLLVGLAVRFRGDG